MSKCFGLIAITLVLLVSQSCSGGGDEESKLGGNGCEALGAKIFHGETCNQTARTPVVALLLTRGSEVYSICTGSLVTLDDILTSAHCLEPLFSEQADNITAIVGGDDGEVMSVINAAIHPFYDLSVGSPYDVAMLTIDRVPSPPIGPLPILLSQLSLPGQRMTAFGYGTANQGEVGVLKAAEVRLVAAEGGNLYASIDSGSSICPGDSGGPIVQKVNGVTTQIGINSFVVEGELCSEQGATLSGFVDLQNEAILQFIANYAPDVPFN